MSKAGQKEDNKWQWTLSLSYGVGETVGSGGGPGQHLSGTAEPWLRLLPFWNVGLVWPDFLICRRELHV